MCYQDWRTLTVYIPKPKTKTRLYCSMRVGSVCVWRGGVRVKRLEVNFESEIPEDDATVHHTRNNKTNVVLSKSRHACRAMLVHTSGVPQDASCRTLTTAHLCLRTERDCRAKQIFWFAFWFTASQCAKKIA